MPWLDLVAYCFGGGFFANAIPHLVSGVMGRSFQTPFARPPGRGLSSSTVNVVWGFCNIVVSYVLICRVGSFEARDTADIVAVGLGMLAVSLGSARLFGRFHGGNRPEQS
ncbi:MAG: hypothetical protein P4L82_00900 [Ancalomicrobiaceae bacterium]|nr:hypothetical protein [Ancalomicrobiaceae bacterium]